MRAFIYKEINKYRDRKLSSPEVHLKFINDLLKFTSFNSKFTLELAGVVMETLAQLERDYEKAKERGAREDLLRKLEDQINRLKLEEQLRKKEAPKEAEDPFEVLFKKAVDEIDKRYVEGTIDYIREHHRDLYEKTNQAEDRLNEVWKESLKGNATLKEFREILKEWYLLHIERVGVFKTKMSRGSLEKKR